ncbi:hypothetical protein FRB91_006249 [Serendipita sp. 411]|nr:hypothetical protein FRC15_004933 [Serendipita sp. 397]KAG8861541.1 hypothetical protein FRB91_006249 [Serendipita sp. 411]KAG8867671.1 hypothetical protein FRC20_005166 [Serendipita sp. 405]
MSYSDRANRMPLGAESSASVGEPPNICPKPEPDEQPTIQFPSGLADKGQKTLSWVDFVRIWVPRATLVAIVVYTYRYCALPLVFDEVVTPQTNTQPPFNTGLIQEYIPSRCALGELLQNRNLSFERPLAVRTPEVSAEILDRAIAPTFISKKGTLRKGISGFVAYTSAADSTLLETEALFDSAMRNLSMYDENLIQFLDRIEHRELEAFLHSSDIGQESPKERFTRYLLHDPINLGAVRPILEYVCSLRSVIAQLINQTTKVNGLLDKMNVYVHDISDTIRLVKDELTLEEQSFWSMWTETGPTLSERDYNLAVLKLFEPLKEQWEGYYGVLLTALKTVQQNLNGTDADMKAWLTKRNWGPPAKPLICSSNAY